MKIIYVLITAAVLSFCSGCTESAGNIDSTPKGLLKSLFLRVDNNIYHGVIDNATKRVYIDDIQYGGTVSNVSYKLDEGATISPDPKTLIKNWPDKAQFTITMGDVSELFTVYLPNYIAQNPTDDGGGDDPDDDDKVLFFDGFDIDGAPDPEVWILAQKGSSTWSKYMTGTTDQTYVEDGNLILKAEIAKGAYRTGGVYSQGKKAYLNARFEIRAKITKSVGGGFLALWLMPEPDRTVYPGGNPTTGEIDIMEQLNHDSYVYQTLHTAYTHNDDISGKPESYITAQYKVGEYNIYRVDKTEQAIVFYLNGVETLRYNNLYLPNELTVKQWPFNTDFYMILNYSLGGEGTWAGPITDADLPGEMLVDWVKVTSLEP